VEGSSEIEGGGSEPASAELGADPLAVTEGALSPSKRLQTKDRARKKKERVREQENLKSGECWPPLNSSKWQ
jgi:hypothetical protein